MDLEKITDILSEAKENYNYQSYTHFIEWANSSNGSEDGTIIRLIYGIIDNKKKRIWIIGNNLEEEIKKKIVLVYENKKTLDKLTENFCKEFLDVLHNPKNGKIEKVIQLHNAEDIFLIYLKDSMQKYFKERNEDIKVTFGEGNYKIDVKPFLENPILPSY